MILTTYNGADLWLVLAPPNWSTSPKLTTALPFTNLQNAISGRQSRRAFGLSRKHSLEYHATFRDAFGANQFRSALNTLKTELVGVPLWTDIVITGTALTGAGTTVTVKNLPARSGREWVFIGADGFTFEIVRVTAVGTATLTLAARTGYAWPKGSQMFPLLFGKFASRPQLEAVTPSRADAPLSLIENSALLEQITAYDDGTALPTVGSKIPAFATSRLWTLNPDWTRPLDTTENDILYKTIGFQREDEVYSFPNWNRRGLEMEFVCDTRANIAWVERFFADRVGPVKAFFIPTFRNDLELAADIAAGASTFEIQSSAYELPQYDEVPGSAFIAFIRPDGSVFPHRVTEVDGTTIHVLVPFTGPLVAAGTRVAFLLLVCLTDSKVVWEYKGPSFARTRLKFLEVADEYVTPNPDELQYAYVYHFEEILPNGTENEWHFTSYENSITSFGATYTPAPMSHGRIKKTLNLGDSVQLTSWGGDFLTNPLNRFLPYTLNGELKITIAKVSTDGATARILFSGVVQKLSTKGTDWTADCALSKKFNRKVPGFVFQTGDNFAIFDTASQVTAATYKVTGTIATIDGMTITVSGPNKVLDWFSGGYLDTGAAGNGEARSILKSTVSGTTQTITIDRPLVHAVVGQSIDLYPGYDGSIDQRGTKFADRPGFGGFPFRPDTNPTVKGPDLTTPTGGKK